MSGKTAKALRKIQDREMVSKLVSEKNELVTLVNERTKQLNLAGDGLRRLAKRIIALRAEISPLRFAMDQTQYIQGQEKIRVFEEAFTLVTGIPHDSEKFESMITLGAK